MDVTPNRGTDTAALRHLWARHRIASLSDQESLEGGTTYAKAITDLGLHCNLLTQYAASSPWTRWCATPRRPTAPA